MIVLNKAIQMFFHSKLGVHLGFVYAECNCTQQNSATTVIADCRCSWVLKWRSLNVDCRCTTREDRQMLIVDADMLPLIFGCNRRKKLDCRCICRSMNLSHHCDLARSNSTWRIQILWHFLPEALIQELGLRSAKFVLCDPCQKPFVKIARNLSCRVSMEI